MAQEDQSLNWFTYYGGDSFENPTTLKVEPNNNIFLAGTTESSFGMASNGAYQTESGGLYDGFISMWSPDGSQIWATFFGGDQYEELRDITVLDDGSVIAVGRTESNSDIATEGAYQTEKSEPYPAGFISKFNSTGQIIWSTYLSGSLGGENFGVASGINGEIIVTGLTVSPNQATNNVFQTELGGGQDGFISKFSSDGNLIWYTYFGGAEDDVIYDAKMDSDSNIVVLGYTRGLEGLASPGATQESGSEFSLILGKFNQDGQRIWSTYISGEGTERFAEFTLGDNNEIIVTSSTTSLAGISTPGAYQESNIDEGDAQFIAKYSSAGNKMWATYIGNSELTNGTCDIAYLNSSIYFVGDGGTDNQVLISGSQPFQPENNSANTSPFNKRDAVIVKLNEDGFPQWGTYFGGEGGEYQTKIAPTNDGSKFFIAGSTSSVNFYATGNSWQQTLSSQSDNYLALLSDETLSIPERDNSREDISIFPNPASHRISVIWNPLFGSYANIEIVNILGETVYTNADYTLQTPISISVPSGLYILKVKQSGKTYTKKIIIE